MMETSQLPADLKRPSMRPLKARGKVCQSREKFFEEAAELLLGLRDRPSGQPVPVDAHWEKRVDAFVEKPASWRGQKQQKAARTAKLGSVGSPRRALPSWTGQRRRVETWQPQAYNTAGKLP